MSLPVTDTPATQEAPPRRKKRWTKRRTIGLAALVVVLGIGLTAFLLLRPQTSAQAQDRTRSFTAQAEKGTQTLAVGLTGTLAPQTQANLNFPVSGTVTKVYVAAGDTVKKGDKLARVDDGDLQNALKLAKANLATAEANLDDVEDDGTSAAITAAKAQVRSAKASVTSAQDDLDNAVLRSTIEGTVASVSLSVGDTVTSSGGSGGSGGSTLGSTSSTSTAQIVVISTDKWKLDGTVGSSDVGSLEAGQAVAVTPDGASQPIDGEVVSVGIVATSSSDGSATFPVEINLTGDHPELFSGTTASATITVAEYPDVLTVPTLAIRTADGASVVTRVDGDQTDQVEVTVGRVFGEATEVTAGLTEGDTVQISFTMPDTTTSTDEEGGMSGGGFPDGGGFPGGGGAPPDGGGFPGGNGGQRGNR
ncbi:MAG: biotin/lipoyl-binding protein [Propionibacteriaceae bacterium]|nr:biotin/lipoyl-binding protein [Propionibacteriaceae bacterium]